ncbi:MULTISPECIES: hypothetical protein [Pseudomonas]|uniref:hypothetical protein n=1 Tax=Pseudomonas TaxID=286 RepID=UPI0011C43FDF|nr:MULTISPECIES: hypothetical protein [Pseudomonas]
MSTRKTTTSLLRSLDPCSEVIVRFIRQDLIDEPGLDALAKMEIAFTGVEGLDDRTDYSVARSRLLARRSVQVRYDPEALVLHVGGKQYRVTDAGFEDFCRDHRAVSIVVDATSLDFSEIALLLYAYTFSNKQPRVGFLYVEPKEYVRRNLEEPAVHGAAFDLSSGFSRQPIPPFIPLLTPSDTVHLVAFLGFEGGRLTQKLNEDDGQHFRKVTIVFGIPPFQATWDLEAFMANSRLLETSKANVKYCGANNPKAAYDLLMTATSALTSRSECNRLAICPFGTKPMAIGAALYCADQRKARVLFDHPKRKPGRTRGVHCMHWYEVEMA